MTETELEKKWKAELKANTLSVYDECLTCGSEGRLNKGICFKCWVKMKKGF